MSGGARVLEANRSQLSWDLVDLEGLLASDHRARIVWRFVETLELGPFYASIRSREGVAGHPAADPKVLLALWLYATLEGVGSARELEPPGRAGRGLPLAGRGCAGQLSRAFGFSGWMVWGA